MADAALLNLFQLRPGFPGVPAFLKLRLASSKVATLSARAIGDPGSLPHTKSDLPLRPEPCIVGSRAASAMC